MIKTIVLLLYYVFLRHIPMQPMPGYRIGYKLRYLAVRKLLAYCGEDVVVKDNCYFGNGNKLKVGDRSQLGQNARLGGTITIGDDVVMGPDVVMMATSHEFKDLNTPINMQGAKPEEPIVIGNDCWIGTRVIILPGVHIGNKCIVAAGAVVTRSFPDNCIIGGVPAKLLKIKS
ncbi:MAG: acyltransferase [Bacteroidaceae bacterium]|nr:acyltransferase [Bacteroidaceae bacterium]